jgi:hypothetical protein
MTGRAYPHRFGNQWAAHEPKMKTPNACPAE